VNHESRAEKLLDRANPFGDEQALTLARLPALQIAR
jgi:hypothetical protein